MALQISLSTRNGATHRYVRSTSCALRTCLHKLVPHCAGRSPQQPLLQRHLRTTRHGRDPPHSCSPPTNALAEGSGSTTSSACSRNKEGSSSSARDWGETSSVSFTRPASPAGGKPAFTATQEIGYAFWSSPAKYWMISCDRSATACSTEVPMSKSQLPPP